MDERWANDAIEIFEKYDNGKKGHLSEEEIEKACVEINDFFLQHYNEFVDEDFFEHLISKADPEKTGKIKLQEWIEICGEVVMCINVQLTNR